MTIKRIIATYNDKDPNYKGDLANHLNMALYALHKMGANDERLHGYAKAYISENQLTTAQEPEMSINKDNYKSYFGNRHSYSAFVVYYQSELDLKDKEVVLGEYVKQFVDGFSGDAFHGLIRLAYAVLLDDSDEIAKALAYMSQCYHPFEMKEPLATISDPIGHLVSLSQVDAYKNFEFTRPLIAGRMADIYDTSLFHQEVRGLSEDLLSLEQVIPVVIELYGRTLDFTMLHGLTSTHALVVLKPYFDDMPSVLQQHFYHLQLAYLSTKCTPIEKLPTSVEGLEWKAIFGETLKSDDAHVIKVVYSLHQLGGISQSKDLLKTLAAKKVDLI